MYYTQPYHRGLRSYSRRNLVTGAISSFFRVLNVDWTSHWAMSEPKFSLWSPFEVRARNKNLNQTSLPDPEVNIYFEEQRNPRTGKKMNSEVSKFVKFIQEPPFQRKECWLKFLLDNLITTFDISLEIRKKDGEKCEPDSLTSFRNSSERHLRQQQYQYSSTESREFSKHRDVLEERT